MTSGPTGVGGLYATVKLDTRQAIAELAKLDRAVTKSAANLNKLRTAGGAGGKAGAAGSSAGGFGSAAAIIAPGRVGSSIYGVRALSDAYKGLGKGSTAAAVGIGAVATAAITSAGALYGFSKAVIFIGKEGLKVGGELERLKVSLDALLGAGGADQELPGSSNSPRFRPS